jgi:hypothetical protein
MINVNEFIPELFLKLTSKTYPHGSEDIIANEMVRLGYLPKDLSKDTHGNYFYKIGESRTIFASHLDTVSSKHEDVKHVLDGETIRTDGTTTLGADDKAGVSIMIWMMKHKIPGTYYFFIGEEVGCIGSGLAAKYGEFKCVYDRIISFDRRGTTSIITHQSWARCCSDEFADAFCAELNKSDYKLNYIKDDVETFKKYNHNVSWSKLLTITFDEQNQMIKYLVKKIDSFYSPALTQGQGQVQTQLLPQLPQLPQLEREQPRAYTSPIPRSIRSEEFNFRQAGNLNQMASSQNREKKERGKILSMLSKCIPSIFKKIKSKKN